MIVRDMNDRYGEIEEKKRIVKGKHQRDTTRRRGEIEKKEQR